MKHYVVLQEWTLPRLETEMNKAAAAGYVFTSLVQPAADGQRYVAIMECEAGDEESGDVRDLREPA
uniref:Uncharacterized protein n=1 Tax=viral metagenome TaxID=1070528 RepID=A0A6M3X731_9ZZZZ